MTRQSDLIIVGAGIVGLATAACFIRRRPGSRVVVLEKEPAVAQHQTGRNSGVIHSGIYYKPGSLKAKLCREGRIALEAFCQAEGLPYDRCGKVIVATDESQLPTLDEVQRRGEANGVASERIGAERLRELEPHARGVAALHVPVTGIVDYRAVSERLAEQVAAAGGGVVTNARVTGVTTTAEEVIVETTSGEFSGRHAINCAGLHSDRVAAMAGCDVAARVVPFRGEYFKLTGGAGRLVKNLIYPTPDPRFPFLGVHFTRMIDGAVECGPNAVLALAREGYTKTTLNLRDVADSLSYGGFLRLATRYWRMGAGEMWRSLSKNAFVRALQRLVPEIRSEHLVAAPAGVRAQVVRPDGSLEDDFLIASQQRFTHVLNAPSPAATASLAIGDAIVDRVADRFA